MADETRSAQLGLAQVDAVPAASRRKASGRSAETRDHVGGSDLLQDALDEVGRHNPELSNG